VPAQPTGTVTFLFSDIEGSTRLVNQLGPERYAETLAFHRSLLRDAFARHEGYEVDSDGDAFFVAFERATDAVAAAAESQTRLGAAEWPHGEAVSVRMGLHTGEPHVVPPAYVGLDVHKAARIMASGHGGQVLLSQSTRELVDVAVSDLGEHRLKDLSAPERIYQLGDGTFPRLKTLHQTNLPVPVTSFHGRSVELAALRELLGGTRLLTLTGPGGAGKTRLAVHAAAESSDGFPDGVWWVPLSSIRDPALVESAVVEALGAEGELASAIGARRQLLVLDNFEQVVDAAGNVSRLLERCPNVTFIVTSRERLQIAGEVEYPVDALGENEAVELFRARAGAVGVSSKTTTRSVCCARGSTICRSRSSSPPHGASCSRRHS
jgi:class 3 adenylate cyclase